MKNWTPLAPVPADDLTDARLQLHWAAQVVAAVGRTLLAPRPDDSHPNLGWWGDAWLVGHPVEDGPAIRAALDTEAVALLLLDDSGTILSRLDLDGQTLEQAYRWLEGALTEQLSRPVDLVRERYEIPAHPVGEGAVFLGANRGAFGALRRWFRNADGVLREVTDHDDGASEVRIWPHHFDAGALILLAPGGDPETSPSIGIGMVPGDDYYPGPYFYVNPYPRPDVLPDWPGPGHWHTANWAGLVLTMTDILGAGDASKQHTYTAAFLLDAIRVLRRRLTA